MPQPASLSGFDFGTVFYGARLSALHPTRNLKDLFMFASTVPDFAHKDRV
jgi:hypothetical protein